MFAFFQKNQTPYCRKIKDIGHKKRNKVQGNFVSKDAEISHLLWDGAAHDGREKMLALAHCVTSFISRRWGLFIHYLYS